MLKDRRTTIPGIFPTKDSSRPSAVLTSSRTLMRKGETVLSFIREQHKPRALHKGVDGTI